MFRSLASFANMVSKGDHNRRVATTASCVFLFPRMFTQGRLRCTQHAILRTALQVHSWFVRERDLLEILAAVAQYQVSTETGSYVPCHWGAP